MSIPSNPYTAIINPKAAKGKGQAGARVLLRHLQSEGRVDEIVETTHDGHGRQVARQLREQGQNNLLVAGGDGTLQQVIDGALSAETTDRLQLAALPLGTGNSFLREFGAHNFEVAAKAIVYGDVAPCDVVCIEHDGGSTHSVNIVSFGFTSEVGALTNQRFKPFGNAGYALAVLFSLATLRKQTTRMKIDGAPSEPVDHVFVAFCNSKFTGGSMMMAPNADVSDGKMQVVVAKDMSRSRLITTFPKIYKGTHIETPIADERSAAEVVFESPIDADLMIDGEILKLRMSALRVLPRAFDLMVPAGKA